MTVIFSCIPRGSVSLPFRRIKLNSSHGSVIRAVVALTVTGENGTDIPVTKCPDI